MYEKVCRSQDFLVNLYRMSKSPSIESIVSYVEYAESIASLMEVPSPGGPMIRITDWSGINAMYVTFQLHAVLWPRLGLNEFFSKFLVEFHWIDFEETGHYPDAPPLKISIRTHSIPAWLWPILITVFWIFTFLGLVLMKHQKSTFDTHGDKMIIDTHTSYGLIHKRPW